MVCAGPGRGVHWAWAGCALGLGVVCAGPGCGGHWPECAVHKARVCCASCHSRLLHTLDHIQISL